MARARTGSAHCGRGGLGDASGGPPAARSMWHNANGCGGKGLLHGRLTLVVAGYSLWVGWRGGVSRLSPGAWERSISSQARGYHRGHRH